MNSSSSSAKGHYVVLDGLRGVASLVVVVFHLLEAHSGSNSQTQIINHGYLAVDFFFLLSGFVVAYAYDDRWSAGMSVWEFCKRRLIRLQPMVVMGSVIGAILFALQSFSIYPKHDAISLRHVIAVMVIGFAMIPLPPSADIRGWNETYPLNGPAWSLFYEYIANGLYAAGIRKWSNRRLGVLVALGAAALVALTVFGKHGDVIGGWSLDAEGIKTGLTRVIFPFFAGMLLMRLGKRIRLPHAFAVCSILLVVALAIPRLGGTEHLWLNGLYESVCIILLFPLIVAVGAGDKDASGVSVRIARFFGDLSYPLYITHYPLIYIYTGWVADHKISLAQGAPWAIATLILAIAIAWMSLKLYDEPVRRWLTARLLPGRTGASI